RCVDAKHWKRSVRRARRVEGALGPGPEIDVELAIEGGPIDHVRVPEDQDVRDRGPMRQRLLAFERIDRMPSSAFPEAVLVGDGAANALGGNHAGDPGDWPRQRAVFRQQAKEGAEEPAE